MRMIQIAQLPQDEAEVLLVSLDRSVLAIDLEGSVLVRRHPELMLGPCFREEVRLESADRIAVREGVGVDRDEDAGAVALPLGRELTTPPQRNENVTVPCQVHLEGLVSAKLSRQSTTHRKSDVLFAPSARPRRSRILTAVSRIDDHHTLDGRCVDGVRDSRRTPTSRGAPVSRDIPVSRCVRVSRGLRRPGGPRLVCRRRRA